MNSHTSNAPAPYLRLLASGNRRLKYSLTGVLLVVCLVAQLDFFAIRPAHAASTNLISADPTTIYGSKIYYTIKRNNKKIGKHSIEFSQKNDQLKVAITSSLTVTVLKIPVYRFRYTSEEFWLGGMLQSVTATTTEKGKSSTVSMRKLNDTMQLQNAKGEVTEKVVEYSSNHWNPGVLSANRLFNTLTAKANKIDIENLGTETLTIGEQFFEATHYRYTGELRVDVWYDTQSRWVKLAFEGSDGSTIEYLSDGFTVNLKP